MCVGRGQSCSELQPQLEPANTRSPPMTTGMGWLPGGGERWGHIPGRGTHTSVPIPLRNPSFVPASKPSQKWNKAPLLTLKQQQNHVCACF